MLYHGQTSNSLVGTRFSIGLQMQPGNRAEQLAMGTRFSIGLQMQPGNRVEQLAPHKNHLGGRGLMVPRFARAVLRSGSSGSGLTWLLRLTMCA